MKNINSTTNADCNTIYTSFKRNVIKDKEVSRNNVADVIEEIRTGKYRAEIDEIRTADEKIAKSLKSQYLSMFFPSIEFSKFTVFEKNDWVKATGLIQFDIDEISIDKSREIQLIVNSLSQTYYSFLSPRGGLKFALISDFSCGDMSTIKAVYRNAYAIAKKFLVSKGIDVELDDATASIVLGCFTSYDKDAYLNTNAEKLILNDEAFHLMREQQEAREEDEKNKVLNHVFSEADESEVLEALGCISKTLKFNRDREGGGRCGRFEINMAVISKFGGRAESILVNHWSKRDKNKLREQLQSQIRSSNNSFTIGTLFRESAIHYGWKRAVTSGAHSFIKKTEDKGTYQVDRLDVGEANEKLGRLIEDFFKNKKSKIILYEAGAGKTARMIEEVAKYNADLKVGKNIAIFVKTYELADEIEAKLNIALGSKRKKTSFKASKVHKIQGMDRLCRRTGEKGDISKEIVHLLGTEICKSCHYGYGSLEIACDYIEQYDFTVINRIRIYTHNHLFNVSRFDEGFEADYVIVDEDIIQSISDLDANTVSYMKDELDVRIRHIFDEIKTGKKASISKSVIASMEAELVEGRFEINLNDRNLVNKLSKRSQLEENLRFARLINQEKTKKIISEKYDKRINRTVEKIVVGSRGRIDDKWKNKATLYLDASGDESILKEYLGDKFEIEKIRINYNKEANVTQVVNKSFSKYSLDNDENIWKKLEIFLKNLKGKTAIVTYMKFRAQLLSIGINDDNILHFGNLRGIDRFKHHDNLVVIGRYQYSSDVMMDKALLFFHHIKNKEDFLRDEDSSNNNKYMTYCRQVIESRSGDNVIVYNWKYIDNRLRMLAEHLETSELYQAIHRLRLIHDDTKKHVYVLTNTVTDIAVDDVVKIEELFGGTKTVTVERKDTIRNAVNLHGFVQFKNSEIAKATGCTSSEIANFKKNNMDWFESTFNIKTVKGYNSFNNSFKWQYLVSEEFDGDLAGEILAGNKNLRNVTVV